MRNPARAFAMTAAALLTAALVMVPLAAGGQDEGRAPGAKPGNPAPAPVDDEPDRTGWDGDGPAPRDVVFIDDLIVDGSACVGRDCVDGEGFEFDTLRLKENVLRLAFRDTSISPFATRDWHLEANSAASGGASYFGIRDCGDTSTAGPTCSGTMVFRVDAGAPVNSVRVNSSGDLGIRTAPSQDLHIRTGDTPTIRLTQDGSTGFTPQTWDVAGNEANFIVRDNDERSLPFRIRPGAPTNSLMILGNGNIGLGVSNPESALHIIRPSNPTIRLGDSTGGHVWDVKVNPAGALSYDTPAGTGIESRLQTDGTLRLAGSLIAFGGDGSVDPGDTFPDYVFAPGYRLRSLAELADFIEANGHLPGVMSAADVTAAGGLDITQLQLQMLEKVEELTLYTLAQHERIRSLEAERAALTARLAAVEARLGE